MMMYSGIDPHSNNSVVAVIDDGHRIVAQKRLPNDIGKITGFLARWQDELAGVVVESTYNWYWLVDGLQDAGFHIHLATIAAIKQYEGLNRNSLTGCWNLGALDRLVLRTNVRIRSGIGSRARSSHAAVLEPQG